MPLLLLPLSLPAEVGGVKECLKFRGSADFHPLMYLEASALNCLLAGTGAQRQCTPSYPTALPGNPCNRRHAAVLPARPGCLPSLRARQGLAAAVVRHGGKIYEGTKAWTVGAF